MPISLDLIVIWLHILQLWMRMMLFLSDELNHASIIDGLQALESIIVPVTSTRIWWTSFTGKGKNESGRYNKGDGDYGWRILDGWGYSLNAGNC